MNRDERITLINPPLWYYQSIPEDLLYAAYYLNQQNINYIIRDLNLESIYFFLAQFQETVQTLNDEKNFYNIDELEKCYDKVRDIFCVISETISPNSIGLNYFDTHEDWRDISEIEKIIVDHSRNPYIRYYESIILSLINSDSNFWAISLFHPDQIIPMFTLCNMVKERKPDIHIHVFGNLEDQINTKILFENISSLLSIKLKKYFDSVSIGNVHRYLSDIYIRTCVDDIEKKEIDVYSYEDKNIANISDYVITQLPVSRLMPKDILNVVVSGGCYWGRCSYCSIQAHSRYWREELNHVVDMLEEIATNGRFSIVRFRDCCLTPHDLDILSERLNERNIKLRWCCRARLEDNFSRDLFEKMKAVGCIMVSFGIESFHPEVSENMNKGIDVRKSYSIIENCVKSGIAVKLTAMYDYPTETYEQAIYNMRELQKISKFCVDIKVNNFILFDNTYISNSPEEYGIEKLRSSNNHDLKFICDFRRNNNLQIEEIDEINCLLEEIENSCSCFMSEEHLLLYLEKYGLDECMKIIHKENVIEEIQ